jgi:hypothetical protein
MLPSAVPCVGSSPYQRLGHARSGVFHAWLREWMALYQTCWTMVSSLINCSPVSIAIYFISQAVFLSPFCMC